MSEAQKPTNDAYRDGWDRIFAPKKEQKTNQWNFPSGARETAAPRPKHWWEVEKVPDYKIYPLDNKVLDALTEEAQELGLYDIPEPKVEE